MTQVNQSRSPAPAQPAETGTPVDVASLVGALGTTADQRVEDYFRHGRSFMTDAERATAGWPMRNPYAPHSILSGKQLAHAAIVSLFRPGEMQAALDELPADARVPVSEVSSRVEAWLREKARQVQFDVAAVEYHPDGSLARMALQDPTYVAQAMLKSLQQE